jgi:Fic family protein
MDMNYKIILSLQVPSDISNLIAEIDEFKGRWEALKNIVPDKLSVLRKVATIASIGSSTRIEGANLSDAEVDEVLSNIGRHLFKNRDEEEVAGYADAMNLIFDSHTDISLSENHIRQLHGISLKYSDKDQRHKGEYKKFPTNVEAFDGDGKSVGIVFETAKPFETPLYMRDLVEWFETALKERIHHPLLIIGAFVVHFLAIHPFQDGNGRLSRILTTLMLLRQGYAYVPYCSLESIVEESKEQYYLSLRRAQKSIKTNHLGIEEWLRYFLKALKKQKDILQKRLEEEKTLSLTEMPALSMLILNLTNTQTKVTVSDVQKSTKANRNTIKKHLQALTKKGLLKKHGEKKGTWYTRP